MPVALPMNGFEPPPSSILATHVVHGNGVPDFDRENFNQLLAEALGSDEHGQPNLGADVAVNHKLIYIVYKIGIERTLEDNPFRAAADAGKVNSQLRTCLEVLQIAIERSPQVIFVKSDRQGTGSESCPLFSWLIPALLPLVGSSGNDEVRDAILELYQAMIHADKKSNSLSSSENVLVFLRSVVAVILSLVETIPPTPHKPVAIDGEDFSTQVSKTICGLQVNVPGLNFPSPRQMLFALARVLKLVAGHSESPQGGIQFRKVFSRFRRYVEDNKDSMVEDDHSEELAHEMRSLSIRPTGATRKENVAEQNDVWPESDRARKRPRLSNEHEDILGDTFPQKVCRQLTLELTGRAVPDLDGLSQTAPSKFRRMSDEDQCKALELLGMTACRLVASSFQSDCASCAGGDTTVDQILTTPALGGDELLKTLLVLIQGISRQSRARIVAMASLRRVVTHTSSAQDMRLDQTPAGDWCLQSLKSSSRDLRVVSARTLQAYVRQCKHSDTSSTHENRVAALDFLHNLWQKGEVAVQETIILALIQMAQVVGDEELNIILIRLIEYLGHTNPYISGLAYIEIQQLAHSLQISVWLLFRPFWRTIGIVFARSLMSRPTVAQQLSSLLGMDMSSLMGHAAVYALPYLVLHKAHDVIRKFAESDGQSTTAFDLCTQEPNRVAILSFLLVQPFPDPEQSIVAILAEVAGDFGKTDLASWVALDPINIACELLKAIGDTGEGKSSRVYQALQLLAQLVTRQRGQASVSRRGDGIGAFLETNVLAIVTYFTVLLNDLAAKESKVEKRRCLAALGEVVKLGKSRVVRALPQICACLRSGLDDATLCDAAFNSWAVILKSLKRDDLELLIDETLAVIVRSWTMLNGVSQKLAHDVVADLLRKHPDLIREQSSTLPSLGSIPAMADLDAEIRNLKSNMDERQQLTAFVQRLQDENIAVIEQALVELVPLLQQKQDYLQRSILREQPDDFISDLTRALLDCCVTFSSSNEVVAMCGRALGYIGCLDASKIESVKDRKIMVALDNFGSKAGTIQWIFFFLEHVLVKAFLSANTTRAQGFLGWAMQQFLRTSEQDPSDFGDIATRLWDELPESVQNVLTPFQTSKYLVQEVRLPEKNQYPLFTPGMRHRGWLRTFTLDLLHRGSTRENVQIVFPISCRIIHDQDISIPAFLLPYAVLNCIVAGIVQDSEDIICEIKSVLGQPLDVLDQKSQAEVKLCSQTVFEVLDYMSTWQQQKRRQYASISARNGNESALSSAAAQVRSVEAALKQIAPDVLAQRALECRSYSRALFHWEQHIRNLKKDDIEPELQRLQDIYAQIDDPDGIEGISAQIHVLDIEQQVLEHKKAGRWTAAQSWYEMQLVAHPSDNDIQKNLMECLKESGQYDALIHHFDGIGSRNSNTPTVLAPYAIEAAWATSRWDLLSKYIPKCGGYDFTSLLADIMLAVKNGDSNNAKKLITELQRATASELNASNVSSFHASHDTLLRLHVLSDIQLITESTEEDRASVLSVLKGRLDVLGSNVADKQYLLGIRRAVMSLRPDTFSLNDIAAAWLSSARLARKAQSNTQAFSAVLKATVLGDKSAAIEQAKLIWSEGHHRKAIQTLESAIESGAFVAHEYMAEDASTTMTAEQRHTQNEMTAKAYVLLGKWLVRAGQTQSEAIKNTFRKATHSYSKGEQGWYHLGRYYNTQLESERALPAGKESQPYLSGEIANHIIVNFLRCHLNGSKYVFQTLPKVLTLWFELIDGAEHPQDAQRYNPEYQTKVISQRKRMVEETNAQIKKYTDRLQPVLLYTILPQVVARICHPNKNVQEILISIIVRVARSFPQQAYWTLLAVVESQQKERAVKGVQIFGRLVEATKKSSKDSAGSAADLRSMFNNGQKFVKELLRVSEFPIQGKANKVSLSRDLNFNQKIAPSKLVVPNQTFLIPSMPTNWEPAQIKAFRPFAKEPVTVAGFEDEALVLNSLQKPRRLTIRGSDGNLYNVLAKPKDDLRKDQRLMEINNMINRFLKRDVDAAKRRLYIRTYAVVPLNEECGLIEWVDNLKTFRDIVLKLYKDKSIHPNYAEIRNLLDEACSGNFEKVHLFPDKILKNFPPVFHEWFVESFPDPSAWFNARLRYTRSAAVMSMVGHVLGLGDRHGENILFEEDNGGTLHVDFNCLFDKGLSFEKPEMVPFRLTHNMVDAMGAYNYEGPFRRCCEITLHLLRSNEDALMTILETFLHDPTTDFIPAAAGRKKKVIPGVPSSPVEVLEGVRGKIRGYLTGESVPLSVGGYVDEMITRATDYRNLSRMYIGWCAFF